MRRTFLRTSLHRMQPDKARPGNRTCLNCGAPFPLLVRMPAALGQDSRGFKDRCACVHTLYQRSHLGSRGHGAIAHRAYSQLNATGVDPGSPLGEGGAHRCVSFFSDVRMPLSRAATVKVSSQNSSVHTTLSRQCSFFVVQHRSNTVSSRQPRSSYNGDDPTCCACQARIIGYFPNRAKGSPDCSEPG
jgi:hypothetical protein